MRKISLAQQIEELEREMKLRQGVYPRWIAAGKMRQAEADYHLERLGAAIATLRWLAGKTPELVRQRLSY